MGTATSSVTGKGNLSPKTQGDADALVGGIARSRAAIGETLEELHGVLNPRILKEEILQQVREGKEALKADIQVEYKEAKAALAGEIREIKEEVMSGVKAEVDEAKTALREATIGKVETMVHNTQESVRGATHSLVSTIKANPVPAALVGVGLVWMLRSARSSHSSNDNNGHSFSGQATRFGDKLSETAHHVTDAASGAAHAAGEGIAKAAGSVKTAVTSAAEATARETTELAHKASSVGHDVGHRAQQAFTDNPLAVGAAVVVAGALVGLALPTTRKESEWLGGARDELKERAGQFAKKVGAQVQQGVDHVEGELKKAMEEPRAQG